MQAAGQRVSIGVRVGSSTYKAVFSIEAKAQISHFGWSILLIVDWLIWQLLLERKFYALEKKYVL